MENQTKALTLAEWEKPKVLEDRIKRMLEIQQSVMKPGIDYDTIPGCKKPSLLKPGGELLLRTFGLAGVPIIEEIKEHKAIRYRVRIDISTVDTKVFLGSGVGEASTDEEKYKWRKAVCDEEYDDFDDEEKRKKWFKADRYHSKPYSVKQVRTNPSDVANTVLKMAKKRALIDGTLTVLSASRIYSQDIEDMSNELQEMMKDETKTNSTKPADLKPTTEKKRFYTSKSSGTQRPVPTEEEREGSKLITEKQGWYMIHKLKESDIPEAKFLEITKKISVFYLFKNTFKKVLKKVEEDPGYFGGKPKPAPVETDSRYSTVERSETLPEVMDQKDFISEAMELAKKAGFRTEEDINKILQEALKLPDVVNITNIPIEQQETVLDFLKFRASIQ